MKKTARPTTSHVSIIGVFVMLVLFLSVPLVLFSAKQNQDIRQKAAEIIPSPDVLQPLGEDGYISGYVYFDKNKDGERNYGEESLAGVQVKITQVNQDANQIKQAADITTTLTSDVNGFFKLKFSKTETATYSFYVQVILPDGYKTVNTNPLFLTNVKNDSRKVVEFGIFPLK